MKHNLHTVSVIPAKTVQHIQQAAQLLHEYAANLDISLAFQNFDAEVTNLPGEYAPERGALLLAFVDDALAGCCALRPLDTAETPNAAEMKPVCAQSVPLFWLRQTVG